MPCDHSHPHKPNNAKNLQKITYRPYTRTLSHVLAINYHPQPDTITKEYKKEYMQFTYTILKINKSVININIWIIQTLRI